jgi:hypothetical protein
VLVVSGCLRLACWFVHAGFGTLFWVGWTGGSHDLEVMEALAVCESKLLSWQLEAVLLVVAWACVLWAGWWLCYNLLGVKVCAFVP